MLATAGADGGVSSGTSRPAPRSAASETAQRRRRRCRLQPDGALVAFVRGGSGRSRRRRRRDLGRRPALADRRRCESTPSTAKGMSSAGRRLQPRRPHARDGGSDTLVHLWDVRTGKLVRELEQRGQRRWALEFSPDGSDPRRLRRRALRVPLGRRDGSPDRPEAHGRQPRGDDRSVPRRTPAADDARQRPGGRLGHRPGVVGAARLRAREPHADPRGVGGVPPGPAVRAGLREPEPDSGADRPGEARERGRRSEAAGAETPPHEQRGRGGLSGEPEAGRAEALAVPPRRQPDDEQTGVAARLQHALLARRSQQRLGRDAEDALDGERAVREQAARVAPALLRHCGGTCEPERRIGRRAQATRRARPPPSRARPLRTGRARGPRASRPEERAAPRRRASPQGGR